MGKDKTHDVHGAISTNGLRCRGEQPNSIDGKDGNATPPPVASPTKRRITAEEIDSIIDKLPPWQGQLSLRGLLVGTCLGVLFAVITLKLSLGTAGIIPSLNIPAGLISFALLKSWTAIGSGLSRKSPWLQRALFQPFGLQENAVLQTFILSISGVAFTGGFGTYLTGMGYQAYLNLGGAPRGEPGYNPDIVYDPELSKSIPYLLMTAVLGVFMLTQLRKLMICDWRLPFPSGTASGVMLSSFHTASGEAEAMRKVRMLGWTGTGSFFFSMFKWFLQGDNYECGFGVWPTFGFKALENTWNIDWQLNYVGAGMICPHIVNWSMLLGAIISWGLMWPLMKQKEGDWYPAGLKPQDFQGLFGYKVFLTISILMGEGMYMVLRVLLSTSRDGVKRLRELREARKLPKYTRGLPSEPGTAPLDLDGAGTPGAAGAELRDAVTTLPVPTGPKSSDAGTCKGGGLAQAATTTHSPLIAADSGAGHHPHMDEEDTEHFLEFKESANERRLRTEVFLRETIPWWLAPLGYGGLGVLATIFIPLIYTPVKWYYVLVAYVITPLFALPNSYGTGLTDWDNCSMYGKLALFIFAAWAGATGNGIIVGLGICGVVFGATSSAATLMGDFRTGYICLAAPRAMFVAQLTGQLLGAVLAPLAFMLYYSTGMVNVPGGPYPSPFSTIYRGMALIGTQGFGALPKYCGVLMLSFFLGGMAICLLRDLLPRKYGQFVPSPMAMGIPFYIGAASAIDFWLGSVIVHIWEFISKESADELGPTVGAGLLVGDGLWSIPSSIIAIAGKAPPVCMGFYEKGINACKVPYCMGLWLGGSERIPTA